MSEQKEQICDECKHPESEHFFAPMGSFCKKCNVKNDAWEHTFKPRPESQEQVGAKTFEEWWKNGEGKPLPCSAFECAKLAYEAGQQSVPAPGRWVKCSERLPDKSQSSLQFVVKEVHGRLHVAYGGSIGAIHHEQWFDITIIPPPPAVEQDEDEEFVKQLSAEFYLGENVARKIMLRLHAREKGKP